MQRKNCTSFAPVQWLLDRCFAMIPFFFQRLKLCQRLHLSNLSKAQKEKAAYRSQAINELIIVIRKNFILEVRF